MNTLTISYPDSVVTALDTTREDFEQEAREIIAVKLYESGRLSSGLAAKIAGVSREEFMYVMSRYGVSPFGTTVDELEQDIENALRASRFG